MQASTIEVEVPENLLRYGLNKEAVQRRVNKWLVLSLFAEGKVSSGKAASLLEMTRIDFLKLLHEQGIAYFDWSEAEFAAEMQAVSSLNCDPIIR